MQTKRKFRRYLIALVLLVAATFATVFIKDSVEAANPEQSLPIISVTAGYNPPYVVRAGYTWNFGFKTVRSPYLYAADVPLMVTDCGPEDTITIGFTSPYEYTNVYITKGLATDDFSPVYDLKTPKEDGIYVYRIEAYFEKGDMLYYFAVNVKSGDILS